MYGATHQFGNMRNGSEAFIHILRYVTSICERNERVILIKDLVNAFGRDNRNGFLTNIAAYAPDILGHAKFWYGGSNRVVYDSFDAEQ